MSVVLEPSPALLNPTLSDVYKRQVLRQCVKEEPMNYMKYNRSFVMMEDRKSVV